VQKIEVVQNKIYLWNENVFRVLEIKYAINLDNQVDEWSTINNPEVPKGEKEFLTPNLLGSRISDAGSHYSQSPGKKSREINLLDSIYICKESLVNDKYKQIRNMDFENYEVKSIISIDQVLLWSKSEQLYYVMAIDSSKIDVDQLHFNQLSA
jgi:hypothetical protein